MHIQETVVSGAVVGCLVDMGWTVYQEVVVTTSEAIVSVVANQNNKLMADIVARKEGLIWVIEAKSAMTREVEKQAWAWRDWADMISVAVPASRKMTDARRRAEARLAALGIGSFWTRGGRVVHYRPATERPRRADYVMNALDVRQKDFVEAGNPSRQRWSPWQETRSRIIEFVKQHPGVYVRDLVRSIPTHYRRISVARVAISQWATKGKIPGIYATKKNGMIALYPRETDG